MKKTLKTLLLALLVVCTVCILTVMVGAEGETHATEGYVRLYESDKTTAAVHAGDTNYLKWKVESDGTDDVLTIFLESKKGATKSETTLTFNTDPGWDSSKWGATKIPWFHHLSSVTKVVIEAPITAINQDYAFDMLKKVHTFVIPSDKVIAISGSMMFANMNELTKFGPVGTADNTLDFRNINGQSGQCFESTSVGKTITLLCPYATAFPTSVKTDLTTINNDNSGKLFANTTVLTIKALEGTPAYETALVAKQISELKLDISPFADTITVEPYDTIGLVVEGVTSDGDAKWALDLGTKTLTVEKAGDGHKEFCVHDSAWKSFATTFKNMIETVKIDTVSKFTLNGATAGLFPEGSDTVKTIILEKGQRIANYWAASNYAFFQNLPALTTIDFVADINDISGVEYGVVDLTGWGVNDQDAVATGLKNAFNGDSSITKVILPDNALITMVHESTFTGCKSLTSVVIGENITTIENGAFANWINSTEGYANLTVTFTEVTEAANELKTLEGGRLTVIVSTAATSGPVDGDAGNENDLVWNFDIASGKLTISGTSTSIVWAGGATARWDGTLNNWNFSTVIPWYNDYRDLITEVEITAPVTAIPDCTFGLHSNLVKVTVPTECVSIGTCAFVGCKALKTVGIAGNVNENVIDLRNFTGTNGTEIFNDALDGEVTIYLPKNEVVKNDVFGVSGTNAHFVVYPGSASETQVYNMINNRESRVKGTFTKSYYTETQDKAFYDEYMKTISCEYKDGDYDGYTYHKFDIAKGVVTVTTKGTQAWNAYMDQNGWKTMKTTWKYAIKQIRFETTAKLTFGWALSELADFPELEAILFNPTRMQQVGGYLFEKNTKLATIGTAANAVKGTYNLSTWNDVNNAGLKGAITEGMFAGNTAFDTLVLPANATKDYKIISIGKNAFNGCTGLRTIKIPANCTIESVDSTAFTNITGPVKIINEMSDAILANKILDLLPNKDSYIYSAPSSEGTGLKKGITFDAWKVRISDYNGLRGVFYFDNSVTKTNEENGWTLVEYGALLTTSAKKNVLGATVYYDGTASSVDSHVKYWPIYKDGVVSGKTLKGADVEKKNATYFAVSVTKYNKNYTTDVYMAGYEIWKNSEGQFVIKYTDYANEAYKDTSIYDISMSMYMAGVINSAIDADDIVWDTLVAGGALTLTEGTDYAKTHSQVAGGAENLKDLNGDEFGDTFTFADVTGVTQSISGTNLSFNATDLRISIFAHPEKAGKYVLVYGTANGTKVQLPGVATTPWDATTRVNLQFSNTWFGTSYTVANKLPNPVLTNSILGNIDYIVLDKGVTKTNGMCFFGIKATRLVYSDDLAEIAGTTFQGGGDALTTIFKAGTVPVEGRFDLHYIPKVNLGYTFNSCVCAKEIWLPENVGTLLGSQTFQNCYRAVAIWCGDYSNRQENVANFGNTVITSLGTDIFNYNKGGTNPSTLTKVILPNGVSYTDASWGSSNIKDVENLAAVESASGYSMIVVK